MKIILFSLFFILSLGSVVFAGEPVVCKYLPDSGCSLSARCGWSSRLKYKCKKGYASGYIEDDAKPTKFTLMYATKITDEQGRTSTLDGGIEFSNSEGFTNYDILKPSEKFYNWTQKKNVNYVKWEKTNLFKDPNTPIYLSDEGDEKIKSDSESDSNSGSTNTKVSNCYWTSEPRLVASRGFDQKVCSGSLICYINGLELQENTASCEVKDMKECINDATFCANAPTPSWYKSYKNKSSGADLLNQLGDKVLNKSKNGNGTN